jgi:hypothetical protein
VPPQTGAATHGQDESKPLPSRGVDVEPTNAPNSPQDGGASLGAPAPAASVEERRVSFQSDPGAIQAEGGGIATANAFGLCPGELDDELGEIEKRQDAQAFRRFIVDGQTFSTCNYCATVEHFASREEEIRHREGPEHKAAIDKLYLWDFSILDSNERKFFALVKDGPMMASLQCKLCSTYHKGQDALLGHIVSKKHKNKVSWALTEEFAQRTAQPAAVGLV